MGHPSDQSPGAIDASDRGSFSKGQTVEDQPQIPVEQNAGVKRALRSRHIQMIAIGGIIGPGLLVGSGGALAAGGPAALLIVFAIVGGLAWMTMQSVGELSTLYPQGGSFMTWTGRFGDDALSLVVGVNYWIIWVSVLANEINVLSLILRYWTTALPTWAWVLILTGVFTAFACIGVGAYGEAEFWLATVKLIGLLAFFIAAICIDVGAIGDRGYLGFRYFHEPGAFSNGFAGVASTFSYVATYYAGVEAIAVTAGECRDAVRAIPTAIKQVAFRILFVYMLTALFYSITVPYNAPNLISATSRAAASPMSIALVDAGWRAAPNLINAFILVAVLSAINSCIYIASRTLLFLAAEGKAPKLFAYTSRSGVPIPAVLLSGAFGLVALVNSIEAAGRVYSAIVNVSSVATFICWAAICFIHIRWQSGWRAQGRSRTELPYRSWWQPHQAYSALALNLLFILVQGYSAFAPFDVANFAIAYVLLPFSAVLYIGWKVIHGTRWVRAREMDLDANRLDLCQPADNRHGSVDTQTDAAGSEKTFERRRTGWRRVVDKVAGNT